MCYAVNLFKAVIAISHLQNLELLERFLFNCLFLFDKKETYRFRIFLFKEHINIVISAVNVVQGICVDSFPNRKVILQLGNLCNSKKELSLDSNIPTVLSLSSTQLSLVSVVGCMSCWESGQGRMSLSSKSPLLLRILLAFLLPGILSSKSLQDGDIGASAGWLK